MRGTALEPLASKKLRRSLRPLFKTKVRRTIYPVATEAARIELAVDSGSIRAGRRSQKIRELELELKHGQPSELFRVARELSKTIPVRLLIKSKADRGYELLNGRAPAVVKAAAIELAAGTGVAEAFCVVARSCLAQILGNEAGVQAKNPEALHQIRIGLRRLRAAVSFFSDLATGPESDFVKSELKWVTGEFSPARDLHVYTSEVLGPFREHYKDNADFRGLCRYFERKRSEAFDRAAKAVRSERYRQSLLELAAWIEAGPCRPANGTSGGDHERPIERYAADELARRRKKIMKKVKAFASLDAAKRHKLRIAAKKFRYASEFLASVFPSKKSKHRRSALLESVKRVQDCLGTLNDIAVHERLSLGILDEQDKETPRVRSHRAFIAGLLAGQQEAQARKLSESAEAALADLRDVKAFWK